MQGADAAQEAFPLKSWDQVFREALDYAQIQVAPLHWRTARGGVLPHGYDSNSIAAQAILDVLKTLPPQANPTDLADSRRPSSAASDSTPTASTTSRKTMSPATSPTLP